MKYKVGEMLKQVQHDRPLICYSEGETRRITKTVNEILLVVQDDSKLILLLAGEGGRKPDEVLSQNNFRLVVNETGARQANKFNGGGEVEKCLYSIVKVY